MSAALNLPRVGQRFGDHYRTTTEQRIIASLMLAGFAFEPDNLAAEAAIRTALDRWLELGLRYVDGPNGDRLFDPVEVNGVLKTAAREGRDSFLADHFVPTGRRLLGDLAARPVAPYVVDFERRYAATASSMGDRVRLRVPLPLGGYHGASVSVEPRFSGVQGAVAVTDGRLELRGTRRGEDEIVLGCRIGFDPSAPVGPDGSQDDHLKASEGLIQVSARVRALADALAKPGTRPREALRNFWTFLLDQFVCGAIHYDQLDPEAPCDWALDAGCFDCNLGSALLVALCRAKAIPARLVGGHVLYKRAPTNHFWAEVWFDDGGWFPVDLLGWDLSAGGVDGAWRDHFYGAIDHRMVTQCFPRQFTGALGVALPDCWHILQVGKPDGIEVQMNDISGRHVYVDEVKVLA